MLTASSGNATGGVGSAYRDLSALSGRQEVTLDPAAQSESISESITSALTNIGLGLGFPFCSNALQEGLFRSNPCSLLHGSKSSHL